MDNESLVYVAIGCIVLLPVLAIGLRNPIVFLFCDRLDRFLKNAGVADRARKIGPPRVRICADVVVLGKYSQASNCPPFAATDDTDRWIFWLDLSGLQHRWSDGKYTNGPAVFGNHGGLLIPRIDQLHLRSHDCLDNDQPVRFLASLVNAILAWMIGLAVASIVGVAAFGGLAPDWAVEETGRICSTLKRENQVPSMILPIILVVLLCSVRKGMTLPWRVVFLGLTMAALIATIGSGSRTAL